MLNLIKPRYVMPFHGDQSASTCTASSPRPSACIRQHLPGRERAAARARRQGRPLGHEVQSGMIFVDGVDIGDVTDVALRDRRMLSADGIFVVVATISEQDGSSVAEPEVIFRGVPYAADADKLIDQLRACVEKSLARAATDEIREIDLLQEILHDDLAAFVYDKIRRRPMVLPVVVEV